MHPRSCSGVGIDACNISATETWNAANRVRLVYIVPWPGRGGIGGNNDSPTVLNQGLLSPNTRQSKSLTFRRENDWLKTGCLSSLAGNKTSDSRPPSCVVSVAPSEGNKSTVTSNTHLSSGKLDCKKSCSHPPAEEGRYQADKNPR